MHPDLSSKKPRSRLLLRFMRYGFVIDHTRCIGCHACTVACKEEHSVPVGVNRTWVKYIEKGTFPDASLHFGVLRCNHCDDAPCIEICPTVALFKRTDGIVDFDNTRCIGCKACMQACPYDALYIDPEENTAAKCNFCTHRIETGMQPACEVVCPVQAIISGDLDDPASRISTIVANENVIVRKPEKKTEPKVFYVGIDPDVLEPARQRTVSTYVSAERHPDEHPHADATRPAAEAGDPLVVYDAPHPTPWGWMIGAYLWTKSIGAGALMIPALLIAIGYAADGTLFRTAAPLLALGFTGLTTFLLVVDLKRPERFLYLLFKPNLRSWLVIGGYILILYSVLSGVWFLIGLTGGNPPGVMRIFTGVIGVATACYSAFLFAQAKARDLWQSRAFFWHLILQAFVAGGAALMIAGVVVGVDDRTLYGVRNTVAIALVVSLILTLSEIAMPMTRDARRAHELMIRGPLRKRFWGYAVALGTVAPLLILLWASSQIEPSWQLYMSASLLAWLGVWVSESLWVEAGQAVPLS